MKYTVSFTDTTRRLFRVEFNGTKSELEVLMGDLVAENAKDLNKLPVKFLHAEVWSFEGQEVEVKQADQDE